MNKRILLIMPPFERLKGSVMASFPIGLGYLATVLDAQGYEVKIYNTDLGYKELNVDRTILTRTLAQNMYVKAMEGDSYVWDEISERIRLYDPDVAGIHVNSTTFASGLKTAELIKKIKPGCFTVFGGPHATILPEEVIQKDPVDFVIKGEGEYPLIELCRLLEKGRKDYSSVFNLAYKDKSGKVVHNEIAAPVKDLDKLPIINRDLLLDRERFPSETLAANISASRGCPYRCTFCAVVPLWGKGVRYRSIGNIIDELHILKKKYDMKYFYFNDDTFTSSRNKVKALCERLIQEKLDLRWTCQARVNTIDKEILLLLKAAGCEEIQLGIESGSERILQLIKKDITLSQIKQAVRLIKKYGISLTTYFMVGLPYETSEDIEKTIELIKELKPDHSNLSTFTPYPGTELYDMLIDGRHIETIDWGSNYRIGHHSLYNDFNLNMEKEELKEMVLKALKVVERINKKSFRKLFRRIWRKKYFYAKNFPWYLKRLLTRLLRKHHER